MLLWSAAMPGNLAELVAISASSYAAARPSTLSNGRASGFCRTTDLLDYRRGRKFGSIFEGPDGLLLLYRLNCFGTNLFILDLRSFPASAERLDKVNRHHHLLAQ